jgi:phosphoesterase RecJ-like protein
MDGLPQVLQAIQQRKRLLVTSHARPDGDAIGSTLALQQVLTAMGKQACVVLADSVPVLYQPLPFAGAIRHSTQAGGDFDAVIILECDSVQRTRLEDLEGRFLINIDHHSASKQFASINWIDPAACAVGEMVYRLALAAGVTITPEIATCLYAAVLTDTGSFCYSPTNAHTFELARTLVERGADPAHIAQNIYFSSPLSKMRLLGVALSGLHREDSIAWMSVTRDDMERCQALEEDCEGLVNYALGIAGIEVAVFFREVANDRVRVSVRSKGAVNVATVAEKFGGGGHECASGFSIEGPVSAAAKRVLGQLRDQVPQVR